MTLHCFAVYGRYGYTGGNYSFSAVAFFFTSRNATE